VPPSLSLPLLEGQAGNAKAGLEVGSFVADDVGLSLLYDPLPMQPETRPSPDLSPTLKPWPRALLILVPLTVAAVGLALYLRYRIIQNTPIGLACEAGKESLSCTIRLAAINVFVRGGFGWTALAAALMQLWRPNIATFGIGLVSAAFGLVLYNTRLSALAVALLVLSLARVWPGER
jgi:ABC-type uncharacterized transport system permease subunit